MGTRSERKGAEQKGFTCVNDALDLDTGVVKLFGESVNSLQQVFTCLRVDVRPPGRYLDWTEPKRVALMKVCTITH